MRIVILTLWIGVFVGPLNEPATADAKAAEAVFEAGDFKRARALYRPLAESVKVDTQHRLGRLLILHAEMEGMTWLRKSASAGHLPAEFKLGHLYTVCMYFAPDKAKGVSWLTRTIENKEGPHVGADAHRGTQPTLGRAAR